MTESNQQEKMRAEFLKRGYAVQEQFLPASRQKEFFASITDFRQTHVLPEIHRKVPGRSLHYFVIDGEQIEQHLPAIVQLYQEVNVFVCEVAGEELVPLQDKKVGVNVNITPQGGVYRWHYDRNAVTALLYLNEVTGGEIEFYPNYRLFLGKRTHTSLQKWLDSLLRLSFVRNLFSRKVVVKPAPGRLVLIRGNRTLHSVRPVVGDERRINIVLSYDLPHGQFLAEKQLDAYLYTQEAITSDPNYG